MMIEDAYILPKGDNVAFHLSFWGASIKENGCTQPTIGQVQYPHKRNAIPMHSKKDK